MMIEVRIVNLQNSGDVKKFIQLPFRIYQNDPNWVPPLRKDIQSALNPDSCPFFKHSQAAFFLAEDNGQVVGRIAALDNQRYRSHTGENAGFFYYFEAVDNIQISRLLFTSAFEWSQKRGLNKIIGPKGLVQGDGLGLLIEGFEYLPAVGIPYNPPYYVDMVVDAGFEKYVDYLSGYLAINDQLPDKFKRLVERVKKKHGFWVKEFTSKEDMRSLIPHIRKVYNEAFIDVPAFVPITEEEVQLIANRILSIADPKLITLIYQKENLVGFIFSYRNISKGLKKAKGSLFPFGWYFIMKDLKSSKWIDINGMGLLPNCQGLGATAVLYSELEKSIKSYPFEKADIVQIAETNLKSFTEAEHIGVHWHKRHRIYERPL